LHFNLVVTPFGELRATAPIAASARQQVTGPWGGPRRARESIDSASGTGMSASVAIGRHENDQVERRFLVRTKQVRCARA
jgi:hypothetical protein